ncbi:MAG: DUF4932 domain-containing protein [Elusimicrobia bacterium]|nr:DUF4932 domain-containing protein [Elusimicrobiota bacterium]
MKGTASVAADLDERVELVCALEAAAGGNPCSTGEDSPSLRAARAAIPAGHEAVRLFRAMTAADWRHRHPSLVILDFGPPPGLAVAEQRDHYANAGREDAVSRLLPALRDLAGSAAWRRWSEENRRRHADAAARLREVVEETDYLPPLEEYLGAPLPHEYRFVAAPLLHGSSPHNVLYRRPGGKPARIYTICGHVAVRGGALDFAHPVADLRRTAWHEVCHTVVDGWTQEFRAELEPLSPLYALMSGRARSQYQGPPGWLHMIDEHVIRATVARLSARVDGEEAGRRVLDKERAEGFALIGPVHELLREHEAGRGRRTDLRVLYPRLVALLRRLNGGRAR